MPRLHREPRLRESSCCSRIQLSCKGLLYILKRRLLGGFDLRFFYNTPDSNGDSLGRIRRVHHIRENAGLGFGLVDRCVHKQPVGHRLRVHRNFGFGSSELATVFGAVVKVLEVDADTVPCSSYVTPFSS